MKAGDSGTRGAWDRGSNRREIRQGCLGSLRSQRKGVLGGRFRGLAQHKPLLPIAPLVASLVGTLRVQEIHT